MEFQSRGQAAPAKRRRQNPISCCFCREKKLKCDRQTPCSNCSFRGLSCTNQSKAQTWNGSSLPNPTDIAEILDRLKRLEEVTLKQEKRLTSDDQRPQAVQHDHPIASSGLLQSARNPTSSHASDGSGRHKDAESQQSPASEYVETVQNLEGTGLRRDPWLLQDVSYTEIRIATIQQIASLNFDPSVQALLFDKLPSACTIPSKPEALLLLNYYSDYLEDLQPILHIPTIQNHLDKCYDDLAMGQAINPGILFLLLSIFASASTLMSHHAGGHSPPFSGSNGTRLSTYWASCALDIMKHYQNKSCDMLEVIQATIILGFVLLNAEGFSARAHSYFTANVSRARDLLLHKIDAPGPRTRQDAVDAEIGRRVWWHIVTIDW